jgi:hypothetical protein
MSDINISLQEKMEQSMKKIHSESFDNWVQNFAMNLNDIWHEPSAIQLSQKIESNENHSAIVIGRGPSIKKHKHLELLANSDFDGSIICTDGSLISVLESGITPEKFSKFYVVTIDPYSLVKKFYDNKIVKKHGRKINGIFSTIVHPDGVNCAREAGVKIHWLHTLFDYNEGKKSFNHMAALIVRAKNHPTGLPAIQTGGNVGTSSWFVSWKILKNNTVGLIGINHGWEEGDDITKMIKSHQSQKIIDNVDIINKDHPKYNIYFKKIFNPDFNCECIVDPMYQFYRMALIEFIERSPQWLTTINATEGGSIFGKRIKSMKFEDFLKIYRN